MHGAVVWEAGQPFEVRDDVWRRDVGPGEVVVRIRAAGLCQTDISLSKGHFGQVLPAVLGHEGAGEVTEVGPGVKDVAVGQRVLLTWVPACGNCYYCVRHETYICQNRKRSSERSLDGPPDLSVGGTQVQAGMGTATFAAETVVAVNAVIPIPDDIPFEFAALLGCAVPTGMGAALNSAHVQPGDTVVVIGCGAVGLSAVQGAVIAGASAVVAIDPQASRRDLAFKLGATAAHPPGAAGVDEMVRGIGFDVGIDAVASATTIRSTWDLVRRGGAVVVVGAGKDDEVVFTAAELFHSEKRLIGSFYGSSDMRSEVPRMIALWRTGRLDLASMVDEVVGLDRINEAVERQTSGDALRVVLAP